MEITRAEVIMPGGIELTHIAENIVEINSETSILSVGCGTGEIELYLAKKYGCKVMGIDPSVKFIQQALEKATKRKLGHLVEFNIGDGRNLNFDSDSFDLIYTSGAICEFYYQGIREIRRVLKPKGQCIIIEVIFDDVDVPYNVREVWEGESGIILSKRENEETFVDYDFQILFSAEYDNHEWWMNYYKDRGEELHWKKEQSNYIAHQFHLRLGLFVIQKK